MDSRSVTSPTGDSSFGYNASLASAIEERISNPSSVSDGSGIENLIPGSDGGGIENLSSVSDGGGIENLIPVSDGGIGIENLSSVSDHGCKNWQATFEDLIVLRVVESFSDDMGDHHELSVGELSRGIQGRDEETKEEQMGMTLEYHGYKGRDEDTPLQMHVASCLKVHCSEAKCTVTCEDQDSEDNSVVASAASAFCSNVDSPIGGLKCDRTVDKAVDMLDKKQDYYTTEEECTSEHGLRGHVRAHPEAAFVNIQEDTQCGAVIWQQCGVKTSPEDVIVVQIETGLTVPSAEKTPLIFKGSYGGEEYRKEGTEHSENSLVVKSSISSMSSTSAATSTDFCCCSIDNTTSSSSTPSSFSVESPDSNTSNPGGLLNLESSSETHLIISAGNKPEEVRRQPVVSEKAKFNNMSTASYTDAILKKLACYARTTVSLNSHQNLTSQNGQNGAKKISSQEES